MFFSEVCCIADVSSVNPLSEQIVIMHTAVMMYLTLLNTYCFDGEVIARCFRDICAVIT